jgi:hypothetical protein
MDGWLTAALGVGWIYLLKSKQKASERLKSHLSRRSKNVP